MISQRWPAEAFQPPNVTVPRHRQHRMRCIMPSHIYSMLDMWEESIKSNVEALGVYQGYVHAIDFMGIRALAIGAGP